MRWSSGDYQIAPIAARSTAMGRWRLTPPGVWGRRLRARDGAFRAPARVTFFCCQKKVTKENHLDLRSKDPLARGRFRRRGGELAFPWRGGGLRRPHFFLRRKKCGKESRLDLRSKGPLARYGSCKIGGADLAGGVQRSSLSVKRTVPAFTGAEASATACPATVGVFASTGLAIIKSRLCRLAAAKVGVPVGHGYNYFLACDTAERIIFAVVAGSGSGKLCWHSGGTDNDQENAGYVRESAGGSEQA